MGLNTIKKQTNVDESLGATFETVWIDCLNLTSGSWSFVWSAGTSPVGLVTIEVSNEPNHSDAITLTLSATLAVTGTSGVHVANLDDIPCRYTRLVYTRTSGTATANVWFVGKGDAN